MTGDDALKALEKRYKRQNEYIKDKYDRITITLPKGTKARIEKQSVKVNTLVNTLVLNWLTDQERKDYPKSLLDDISETELPFK